MSSIQEKLKKIKALAERGEGGERDTAQLIYEQMLLKYGIAEEDIENYEVKRFWFRYKDELDFKLATQIFYKVTGSPAYWVKKDKRIKRIGVDCTDFEFDEIMFYFNFYIKHLRYDFDIFVRAFINVNDIYPDSSARCYTDDKSIEDLSAVDLERLDNIYNMAKGMKKRKPNKRIEDKSSMIEDKGGK